MEEEKKISLQSIINWGLHNLVENKIHKNIGDEN